MSFFPRGPFDKKFDGNPKDDRTADKFYELHLKELGGKKSQDHTKDNGRPGSKGNAFGPLFPGQGPDSHSYNHGIIAGQYEVDKNNT